MRWLRFKDTSPAAMFEVISGRVFPFLRTPGCDGPTYSQRMEDARFTIPTPALLAKVVDMLGDIKMDVAATPRATCANTYSPRSPLPEPTGSSAPRGTSST